VICAACAREDPHKHCAQCSVELDISSGGVCPHHAMGLPDEWARMNALFCDLIHRGIVPPRPVEEPEYVSYEDGIG
jgi:hypothetical protein